MINEVVAVCGFPRSGSSLVMQMLHAGGFPCGGTWPAFEEIQPDRIFARLPALRGQAVKMLDAMQSERYPRSGVPLRSIVLRRDPDEQVKSFAKFAGVTMGLRMSRPQRNGIRASFVRDFYPMLRWCHRQGPAVVIDFEDMIDRPQVAARAIATAAGVELDVTSMAAQVMSRSSECFSGMLEIDQVRSLFR